MNTKDFVVLPWGKPGNSVKLKYKNAQELRVEKVQLELETHEMEKKLREFRSTRSKEKEERESNEYHWKSGKAGKFGHQSHIMLQNKGNIFKSSGGKVKLKLLKEQIQEAMKQPVIYKMSHTSEGGKPKIKGKACGQCENRAALLVCLECGEDYCSGCFAKIHQKGALKLHRTTLLQARSQVLSGVLDVAHQFIKQVTPDEPKRETNSAEEPGESQHQPKSRLLQGSSSEVEITTKRAECAKPRDRLLCEGSLNAEVSAPAFQEGSSQGGTGSHRNNEKHDSREAKPDSLEECEVQTYLKIWREPLNIEFKEDSLSYMEKLWLKKHRRTSQKQLLNSPPGASTHPCETTREAQYSPKENDGDSDVKETKVQHPALFLLVEELNIERPEPSLKIVELDETCEEEFEDPGSAVPYKVELADADSEQSCSFHDYQKDSFPHKNDIPQHHVFNKGRSLCLRNSSPYDKGNTKVGTSNRDFDNTVDPGVSSPDIEKVGEACFSERNLKEKNIDMESNQMSNDSCILLESKDALPSINLEKHSIEEKLSHDIKNSLELSNLHERPNFEDSKTTQLSVLLQEIALRSKPITEQYQGLERFFVFDENERLNFLPSCSLECSEPSTRIMLAEDREWIPDLSLSQHADDAAALGIVQSAQNPSSTTRRQKMDQKPQRLSTANLPLSNIAQKSSSCLASSHPRSRSAVAGSLSGAASEIAEMEYVGITDQNELFSDDTADQITLDNLAKELSVLKMDA
ncbi:zinc finger B-box domain-containing protein 1, partial [Carlito syrichta]|uniref:Zinc finger B-box domain-containing protein 1 n=1 Tax=Carlito syrichta TaxID=1868482 RepID=A0A1U7TET3_CARSF